MKTLSERMAHARTKKGLSQAALAKLVKCGQTTLASIENGRNNSSSALPKVAAILGVRLDWLLYGTGEMMDDVIDPEKRIVMEIYDRLRPELKKHLLSQSLGLDEINNIKP